VLVANLPETWKRATENTRRSDRLHIIVKESCLAGASFEMNSSALNGDIEKEVLPWLKLAEDLRVLQLDVEVCVACEVIVYLLNRSF
jgi:hypothetical protein